MLGAEARFSSTFRRCRQNSMHWHRGMIYALSRAQTERGVSDGGAKKACEPDLFPENPKSWILLFRWSFELSRCHTTGIGAILPAVILGGRAEDPGLSSGPGLQEGAHKTRATGHMKYGSNSTKVLGGII